MEVLSLAWLHDIPSAALNDVHTGFADCVGTMIAGSAEEAPQILCDTLAPGSRRCQPLSDCPAPDAAWINAVAAHALDFDDVALNGHPSAVLVPAILAEGEALGTSGARLATAYVAGYEVWTDLVARRAETSSLASRATSSGTVSRRIWTERPRRSVPRHERDAFTRTALVDPCSEGSFGEIAPSGGGARCERDTISWSPVGQPTDLFADAHLLATGGLLDVCVPVLDGGGSKIVGLPARFRSSLAPIACDQVCGDNLPAWASTMTEVLTEAGFSPAEIAALTREKMLARTS